jgi:hypothetical protein
MTALSPITPPPIPRHAQDEDRARRRLWYAVAGILLLLLLVILLILWLLSVGGGAGIVGGGGGGGGGETHGNLGTGDGQTATVATQPPSSSGNSEGKTAGDNAQPQPEAKAPTDSSDNSAGAAAEPDATDGSGGSETALLIYDSPDDDQPVTPAIANTDKPPASGAAGAGKGPGIVDAGGINPFIGSGPPPKSVIYVVDVSNSMSANNRLSRVKASLSLAIEQLKANQRFKVYFFSDYFATDNINSGLLPANQRNKDKVLEWIGQQGLVNGTNPLPAMLEALKLKPEKIVLISDGEFDPTSIGVITQANQKNRSRSRIDCAGLDEDIETLREIAQRNNGIYYQVN